MVLSSATFLFSLCFIVSAVSSQSCKECKCCQGENACNQGTRACRNGCIAGFWGDQCTYSCPVNCKTCTSETVCTECESGFYGRACTFECGKGCINNTCFDYGQCDCKSINFRPPKCFCITGKHGDDCKENCPINCGSCSSSTKCNWCTYFRYHGSHCQFECSEGCYYGICRKSDGTCYCELGLTGDKCDPCTHGKHGTKCDMDCPEHCQICSSNSNCTKCYTGYYGSICTHHICPPGCSEDICDIDGTCTYGCKGGFYGKHCEVKCEDRDGNCITCLTKDSELYGGCTQCTSGNYLYVPSKLNHAICRYCSGCKKNSCNSTNGYCIEGCVNDTIYGNECLQDCSYNCKHRRCERETGHCSNGCEGNWFGLLCEKECPLTCQQIEGKSSCNKSEGYCMYGCLDEYHGEMCNQKCSDKCVNVTCVNTTTICSYGCVEGYGGLQCTEVNEHVQRDGHITSVLVGVALIGLLIGIVFAFVFITWKRRKKQRREEENFGHTRNDTEMTPTQGRYDSNDAGNRNNIPVTYEDLKERDERTYSELAINHQTYEYLKERDEKTYSELAINHQTYEYLKERDERTYSELAINHQTYDNLKERDERTYSQLARHQQTYENLKERDERTYSQDRTKLQAYEDLKERDERTYSQLARNQQAYKNLKGRDESTFSQDRTKRQTSVQAAEYTNC